ncbi:hypothetical protein WJX73_001390 [Symbiochloris irregularis]|uniref:Integral membrane protein n=1 Tax=Symbiochloris irregularis TaxID=706552 RepID=A0AAW1NT36_9CHLO
MCTAPSSSRFMPPAIRCYCWRSAQGYGIATVLGYNGTERAGVCSLLLLEVKPNTGQVMRHFPRFIGGNRASDWHNISWLVAVLFVAGSCLWVLNGWYALFPARHATVTRYLVGWSALLGGTLFELGGFCAFLECINRPSKGPVRFDYKVRALTEAEQTEFRPASKGSGHYAGPIDGEDKDKDRTYYQNKWRWVSTSVSDIGFWGNTITFISATIFWIATMTGVPNELSTESQNYYVVWDIIYWLPQVVGSTGFMLASTLLMLETQHKWWLPRPFNLGWHVGFFNFIGAIGFWLSGLFGFYAYPNGNYQRH